MRLLLRLVHWAIIINFIVGILYAVVLIWLDWDGPIFSGWTIRDLSDVNALVAAQLYIFEAVFISQLFVVYLIILYRNLSLPSDGPPKVTQRDVLIALGLIAGIAVFGILVFVWPRGWPNMLVRRLFAYESWIFIALLSDYLALRFIVPERTR